MWSEKHRPKSILDMVGNEKIRAELVDWFSKWKKGTKPLLLVGPPGVGKTTIATLAAKQFGYDMISLNASDVRSKSKINDILNPVLGNISILGSPMIFVDEVDGIHGRADFGGAEALTKIIKEPTVPIILAANSDTSAKMKNIKKNTKILYFKKIPPRLLKSYLEHILKKEGARLSPGTIIRVIRESKGDIRSMINLTQSLVSGFDIPVEESFESINIEEGVNAFFKAKTKDEARGILYSINIDPREKISAFYSSIVSSSISKNDKSTMLEIISQADVLYGKIMRTQQWRLLRYLNEILLQLFKPDSSIRYSQYSISWPLLNKIRWDGKNIKEVCLFLAKIMHTSKSTIATFYLPFILYMMKKNHLDLDLPDVFYDTIQKEMTKIS